MPRIRTLKPQFWDSPSTARADLACRLLFMAMWNWADDAGRGTANLKELEAFAFPNDDVTQLPRRSCRNSAAVWPNFAELFSETVSAYGVTLYEVAGRRYYEISSFRIHQSKHFKSESSLPGPADGQIWDLASEYSTHTPTPTTPPAELRAHSSRNSALSRRDPPLDRDRDRDRDRDVVYDDPARETDEPPPPEPPYDPDAEPPQNAVAVQAPEHIDTPNTRPRRTPSNAAQTLVRQELGDIGNPYPRTTHIRLALQVETLIRENQTDTRIRQALKEWDHRDDCTKPEYLPTVLADLVKAERAQPGNNGRPPNKLRATATLAATQRARENAHTTNPPKELE